MFDIPEISDTYAETDLLCCWNLSTSNTLPGSVTATEFDIPQRYLTLFPLWLAESF